tara:strand:- start:8298 stop:9245 length:948 start_codon:yes stop_codon:yes gene_type:complete
MKPLLKIQFTDFWSGFDPFTNYFNRILSENYNLQISNNPDVLFFSCFGKDYLNYNCYKIFYTAENKKTDFTACDYSISFENTKNPRQFFLPYFGFKVFEFKYLEELKCTPNIHQASLILEKKNKFCAMVVSNGKAKDRLVFFKKLNLLKQVDSGGRYMNTIDRPIADKHEFIKNYKFIISYENESYPNYLTEKVLDALRVYSIPIYWGDPIISDFINPNRIINRMDFKTDEECIERILQIDNNDTLYKSIISQPIFEQNIPEFLNESRLKEFLHSAINSRESRKPVSRTHMKDIHLLKLKLYRVQRKINFLISNN